MKYLAITLSLFLALLTAANAWSIPQTRQEFMRSIATTAAAVVVAPQASHAIDASVFNHQYSDPKHPNCRRIISVKSDGTVAVSGTDGTPGCPEDGSGAVWRLPGEAEGKTILVDFSAKGGPANLKGVWDGDGIKWPDGNKWTVKN